ncbi:ATP-binding protein [Zoogloea sp.]|uniref:ATP-binding protein n=1 Tax=Zoogloea sp. TaxID=49181 RepID=UPI001415B98B|nr:MAG: hypothetical protein F9K15_00980 [Zoogloea sp.]
MKVAVQRSLSFKLISAALLSALALGLLISALQISSDYFKARQQPDEEMAILISLLKEPATAIVFSLDPGTAHELLNGALRHPAVAKIRIVLTDGSVFAERERPLADPEGRSTSDLLFGVTRDYAWDLSTRFPEGKELLGKLELTVDTYHYGAVFMGRMRVTLLGTLIYALLLSAITLVLFYLLVARPLGSVIDSIVKVDVDSPEKARLSEPLGHTDDEIGLLVQVTNAHLQTIDSSLRHVREAEEKLKRYSDSLEFTVAERTHALSESLAQLQATQNHLIESEKLAALGGLVAGVSHEVNTPLGIAVTASSVLRDTVADLKAGFEARTLTSERFSELLQVIEDGNSMLVKNLERAAHLIRDFKRTAVDQVSEACCEFDVRQVMDSLIASLHPETAKGGVNPCFECPEGLAMRSLPGVLTQVMSNLVLNSLRHGFTGIRHPEIHITVVEQGDRVIIEYRDNGVGVPKELHERIFEPFFTTKRGQGGSGLGLNIVYNLVTRKLLGRLEFQSAPGAGVSFLLDLPRRLPVESEGSEAMPAIGVSS